MTTDEPEAQYRSTEKLCNGTKRPFVHQFYMVKHLTPVHRILTPSRSQSLKIEDKSARKADSSQKLYNIEHRKFDKAGDNGVRSDRSGS